MTGETFDEDEVSIDDEDGRDELGGWVATVSNVVTDVRND